MSEIWKDVIGYEGLYQVSNMGRVKSLKRLNRIGRRIPTEKVMSLRPHHKGYLKIQLHQKNGEMKGKFVHTLVAEAFIGPIPIGMQCNHKNGDKADNRPENLEYCTPSYNMLHAYKVLNKPSNLKGEKHWSAKLTRNDVLKIRDLYSTGKYTQKDLAILFNVKQAAIGKVVRHKSWTHI